MNRIPIIAALVCTLALVLFWVVLDRERSASEVNVAVIKDVALSGDSQETERTNVVSSTPRFAFPQNRPLQNLESADPWTREIYHAYVPTKEVDHESIHSFEAWRKAWLTDSASVTVEEGRRLAQARFEAVVQLAKSDPEAAWEAVLAPDEREGLPEEVIEALPEFVETRGDWQPNAICESPHLPFSTYYEVTLEGADEPMWALPVGELRDAGNPTGIALRGYLLGDITLFDGDPPMMLEAGQTPPEEFAVRTVDPVTGREIASALDDDGKIADGRVAWFDGATTTVFESEETWEEFNLQASPVDPEEGDTANAPNESAAGQRDSLVFTNRPQDNRSEGWRTLIYLRTTWNGWTNNQGEAAAYTQWRDINDALMRNTKGRYQILPTITEVIDMSTHAATYGYSPDISTYDVNGLRAAVKAVANQHYGYNTNNYGHTVIYWQNGPGSFGGQANLPGNNISMKTTSKSTTYHELGHNMGLGHAGFLKEQGAEDNFASAIELGTVQEYGHPFDDMGTFSIPGGSASFPNALFCTSAADRENWLRGYEVFEFRDSTTMRIHAFDVDATRPGRHYTGEIVRDDGKIYYLSYYQNFNKGPNASVHSNGMRLEIRGQEGINSRPTLLDPIYWSKNERQDGTIPLGWTFHDPEEALYITPLARAGDRAWMDVYVHHGHDPDNNPPVITALTASNTNPGTGQSINLSLTASDPDGDPLAYHWYYDDDNWHRNLNQPNVSKSWTNAECRSVICTVSDMKGGVSIRSILIRVGNPSTYCISGQIVDKFGNPVRGAPVDNGLPMTNDGDSLIAGHKVTLTDNDGNYILGRIPNGTYNPRVRLNGDTNSPVGGGSVTVSNADVSGVNFVTRALDINASPGSISEDGGSATFTISRDSSYTGAATIPIRFVGKAQLGTDFTMSPALTNGALTLPQNVFSLNFTVTSVGDTATEGPEDITPTLEINRDFSVTEPTRASVWINDAESPLPRVRLAPVDRTFDEDGGTGRMRVTRFGDTSGPLSGSVNFSDVAQANVDFFVQGGPNFTIPAGESTLDMVLEGIPDDATESLERVIVTLATSGNYVRDSQRTAHLRIIDAEMPIVTITAIDNLGTEGDQNSATFRVARTGSTGNALTVYYNAVGFCLHGTDYQQLPGSLTIPAGQSSADIDIVPLADSFAEGTEVVRIWLESEHFDYALGNHAAAVDISDTFVQNQSSLSLTALENAEELGAVPGRFQVSRTPDNSVFPVVDPVENDGTWVQAINVNNSGGTENRSMNVADSSATLQPNDGSIYFTRTSNSWWRGVSKRQFGNLAVEAGTYTVSFYVGDSDVSVPFFGSQVDPASGNHVGLTATDPANPVLPNLNTTANSLINRLDTNIATTFNVSTNPADNTWTQWSVEYVVPANSPLIGQELGFLFRKAVGNPDSNGAFDGPLVLNFTPAGGSGPTFGPPLTAYYEVRGGSATSGDDYTVLSGQVQIPDGSGTTTFDLLPLADLLMEGTENLTLRIVPDTNYLLGLQPSATLSIIDHPMDAWRQTTFGPDATNPLIAGDFADPDGDKRPNYAEFRLLTTGEEFDLVDLICETTATHLKITYDRHVAEVGYPYIEWSTSMESDDWRSDGVIENIISTVGNVETVEAWIPRNNEKNLFGRLVVAPEPPA
ncbi:MAG: Calx-beta domain-containing protein [Verrucomicrobiota bacterium]